LAGNRGNYRCCRGHGRVAGQHGTRWKPTSSPVQKSALLQSLACLNEQVDIPDEYKISMTVHLQSLLRNKRCLLTYMQVRCCSDPVSTRCPLRTTHIAFHPHHTCVHNCWQHRLERISTLRWEAGPAIPPALQVGGLSCSSLLYVGNLSYAFQTEAMA
jgi:hypothetical protein